MFFDLSRIEGFPTQYDLNQTPVTVDVVEAGIICAFLILAISFFISLPTTRLSTNIYLLVRVSILLTIGLFILLSNFGQEWEVGKIVNAKMPYRAGSAEEINGTIAIKIGFRSVNVTLQSDTSNTKELKYETINYNERFEWTWDQGRIGFGPFSGKLQQEFRAAQYRGVPIPILWVMEYFVIDGEGFRFGRFYRIAGWYSHIALWTAFYCWIVANILFKSVITYGGVCLGISGILQLTANLVWIVVRNPNPLIIPFDGGQIVTKFGFSFWLNFVTGVVSIIVATKIIVMDFKYLNQLYIIFGVDPLDGYDEFYLTKEEESHLRPKNNYEAPIPMINIRQEEGEEPDQNSTRMYMARRTILNVAPKVIRTNKPKHLLHV